MQIAEDISSVVDLVFGFDRSARADMLEAGRAKLEILLRNVADQHLRVVSVKVTGRADRLNGNGNGAYTQRLSERRAQTVRDWLVERGIDAKAIKVLAVGDAVAVQPCTKKTRSTKALEECLLPNRRVEVSLIAEKAQ